MLSNLWVETDWVFCFWRNKFKWKNTFGLHKSTFSGHISISRTLQRCGNSLRVGDRIRQAGFKRKYTTRIAQTFRERKLKRWRAPIRWPDGGTQKTRTHCRNQRGFSRSFEHKCCIGQKYNFTCYMLQNYHLIVRYKNQVKNGFPWMGWLRINWKYVGRTPRVIRGIWINTKTACSTRSP